MAAKAAGASLDSSSIGRMVCADHISRDCAALNRRFVPAIPPFNCRFIHFARSATQVMMAPAGALLSMSSWGSASSLPESVLCGVATSLPVPERGDIGERVGHAERREDALADEIVPTLAGDRGNQLAGRDVEQVVVGIGAAETGGGLDEAQALDDLVAAQVAGREEHQVSRAQAESAAVRQQVADGHLARDVGVVQLEAGHVLRHRVVPADLAFIHQHGERGGGERLGVGRDAEQRLRGDRRRLTLLAHAVPFGQHDACRP